MYVCGHMHQKNPCSEETSENLQNEYVRPIDISSNADNNFQQIFVLFPTTAPL